MLAELLLAILAVVAGVVKMQEVACDPVADLQALYSRLFADGLHHAGYLVAKPLGQHACAYCAADYVRVGTAYGAVGDAHLYVVLTERLFGKVAHGDLPAFALVEVFYAAVLYTGKCFHFPFLPLPDGVAAVHHEVRAGDVA